MADQTAGVSTKAGQLHIQREIDVHGLNCAPERATLVRMFNDEVAGDHRHWLLLGSGNVLFFVVLTTMKNSVWMFFTGKWFEGKPIRYLGTLASLGLLGGLWHLGPFAAIAAFVFGFAITDGAVLLAEARQRKSGLSRR
jgi:hypothetical protein